MLLNDIHEEGS